MQLGGESGHRFVMHSFAEPKRSHKKLKIRNLQEMHRKHSLDFKAFPNAAHRRSIFILVRQTQVLFRKSRRLAGSTYDRTSATIFQILAPVLVTLGILAVTATVVSVVYERVSLFLLVARGIDD
jgi:hypothetical protein